MKKIKILYDFKPALDKHKTGIPIFVENIYKQLSTKKDFKIVKFDIHIDSIVPYRPYRPLQPIRIPIKFFIERLFVPFKLLFGKYDVYVSNEYFFNPLFIPKKTKVITVIHDIGLILYDDIQTPEETTRMRSALPETIRKSDLIVTVSKSSKKDIENYLKSIDICKPIEVVYNAPEIEVSSDILLPYDIETDYFLFLGTLEPRKNPLQMVKGFHRFLVKYNIEMKLVFVGKKGWLYNDVMQYIHKHALENSIMFTGYIGEKEKYQILKNASGFIFLSKYEGFGIPPLEALSLGTPVLLNNIEVFHELFEDDGVYVNADDVESIADGMKGLLDTKFEQTPRSLQKFSWEKSGTSFGNVIRNLKSKIHKI